MSAGLDLTLQNFLFMAQVWMFFQIIVVIIAVIVAIFGRN